MDIVITNAHWNNRGDEAAHCALWGELRRLYPGCEVTVLVKDRKSVEQFPDIDGFSAQVGQFKVSPWKTWLAVLSRGLICSDAVLKSSIQVLKRADLIIYPPGGAVICDRFFWSKQVEYLLPFMCAKVFGIAMAVCSPSMGPFESSPSRPTRKWLLQTPKAFCVREDISRRYLESIGIQHDVVVTMDLAFMDDPDPNKESAELEKYTELKEFLDSHEKVVGVTISDFKWHVKLGKDKELSSRIDSSFRAFIAWLTGQGIGVLLIPQLFGNQNDIDDLNQHLVPGVFVMDENKDTYFQQYVISQLHSVIGMRYHSNIFAAKVGTPFIAIPYEEKMQGFLELAGLTDHMLTLDQVSVESLQEKFSAISNNQERIRATLRNQREDWRARAMKTVDTLKSAIGQSDSAS